MTTSKGKAKRKLNGSAQGNELENQEFEASLLGGVQDFFEKALSDAFTQRKDYIVHELTRRLVDVEVLANKGEREDEVEETWIGVESLSRLRSVVGGRFENIKKKWVGAGFPLREHRGDKKKSFKLDDKGWIELSNWILKQGYEARIAHDSNDHLFELRSVSKSE